MVRSYPRITGDTKKSPRSVTGKEVRISVLMALESHHGTGYVLHDDEAETFSDDNVAKNIFGILASLSGCIIELDNRWRLNTVVPVMHKQLYRKNPIPVVNKLLKADRDVLSNLIMHIRDPLTLCMTIFCLMKFDSIGIVPRFADRHFMQDCVFVVLLTNRSKSIPLECKIIASEIIWRSIHHSSQKLCRESRFIQEDIQKRSTGKSFKTRKRIQHIQTGFSHLQNQGDKFCNAA